MTGERIAGYYVNDAKGKAVSNRSFPAGLMCSSYTGECVALLEALEWITDQKVSEDRPIKVLICYNNNKNGDVPAEESLER